MPHFWSEFFQFGKWTIRIVCSLPRFSKILPELKALGLKPGSLDGVIIDSGCSQLQWRDRERGFCHTKKGWLDLRIDPDVAQGIQFNMK